MTISPNITKQTIVSDELIVSPEELGKWLNLSSSAILMKNETLIRLIKTATELIETYSWLSLRRRTYEAYYYLPYEAVCSVLCGSLRLALQRAPIIDITDITKIEYLSDDNWVELNRGTMTIDGLYEQTTERIVKRDWAIVKFREDVPYQLRCNAYNIRITFNAGWEVTETETALKIPESLKTAVLMIGAFYFTNRGDCGALCNMNGAPVPCDAKNLVDRYAVSRTIVGSEYNTYEGYCYE